MYILDRLGYVIIQNFRSLAKCRKTKTALGRAAAEAFVLTCRHSGLDPESRPGRGF